MQPHGSMEENYQAYLDQVNANIKLHHEAIRKINKSDSEDLKPAHTVKASHVLHLKPELMGDLNETSAQELPFIEEDNEERVTSRPDSPPIPKWTHGVLEHSYIGALIRKISSKQILTAKQSPREKSHEPSPRENEQLNADFIQIHSHVSDEEKHLNAPASKDTLAAEAPTDSSASVLERNKSVGLVHPPEDTSQTTQ